MTSSGPSTNPGAKSLSWRLEQQEHWQRAAAVVDGRQPPCDPDGASLESIGDGIRLYAPFETRHGPARICKRLVDGVWEYDLGQGRLAGDNPYGAVEVYEPPGVDESQEEPLAASEQAEAPRAPESRPAPRSRSRRRPSRRKRS